jgi:Flp pilus assembly protein TadG
MMRIIQTLRRPGRDAARAFLRCSRGASLVEFALVFPILIVLVIGLLEVGMMMFIQSAMEGGLREATRWGITGQTVTGETREESIRRILEENTLGMVDFSGAAITMRTYDSFSDVGQPEPWTDSNDNGQYDVGEPYTDLNGNTQWDEDRGVEGVGNASEIVSYTVEYHWVPLTGLISSFIGDGDGIPMRASTVVRNEPFTS